MKDWASCPSCIVGPLAWRRDHQFVVSWTGLIVRTGRNLFTKRSTLSFSFIRSWWWRPLNKRNTSRHQLLEREKEKMNAWYFPKQLLFKNAYGLDDWRVALLGFNRPVHAFMKENCIWKRRDFKSCPYHNKSSSAVRQATRVARALVVAIRPGMRLWHRKWKETVDRTHFSFLEAIDWEFLFFSFHRQTAWSYERKCFPASRPSGP